MIYQEMPKNKMITKGCPKCDMQVPVACKACPCGHTFFSARRTIRPLHKSDNGEDGTARRRTERVKREKPNYYDALEYDNQMKKKVTPRSSRSGASSTEEKEEPREFLDMEEEEEESDHKNSARKRRLRRKATSEQREEQEEEDPMINLPPEKTLQYSIELAEINRKILSSSWKP